jgi:hypothetical protein
MEPAAFTAHVAERFRKSAPGVRCEVADHLLLDIGAPAEAPTGRLNALYAACRMQPGDREALIDGFVAQMAPATRGYAPVLAQSMLRVVVRARADLEAFRQAGGGEPAARPLVGDLWMAVAMAYPGACALLGPDSLARLALSPAEALDVAVANTRPLMRSRIGSGPWPSSKKIQLMRGDVYQCALLVFPDLWAPVARAAAALYVAAPAWNAILADGGGEPFADARMQYAAHRFIAQAERPLSALVLRWTAEGWRVEAPEARLQGAR